MEACCLVSHLDSENMTAMAELPFIKADVREVFEIPLRKQLQDTKRKILVKPQLGRIKLWHCGMKVVKRELCRQRHQEMVQEQAQVCDSPDGSQQVCLPVQLGQGEGHFPAARLQRLVRDQQQQGLDPVCVQPQRQTAQGGIVPNMEPRQIDERWDAPEVTVQVRPQKLSQGWEAPEVTVQVWPQKLSPRWEMPEVTVQMQLQQGGRGLALPHITVQVQPQVQGQQMAGVKVTVQMHSGCEPEEVTHVQDQGDEVLGNGEQLTRKQNQGDLMARYESEREVNEVELVPQGAWNQKQDQEGDVIKFQQEQKQKGERVKVTELQVEDQAGLDRMVTEEQLQDQSQERENLKADLSPQQEGQRDTEMRQDQSDVHIQEEPKGLVEEQQEDLEQEVPKKRPRETPNYFVSIPITDDQILDRIEDVQELIFTKEPDLLRAFLPVQTMHLTIIVAHLATEEEVKKAVLALKQSKAKVEAILQGKDLIMTFHGIGQFNNQVIYVKMSEENQKMLSRIAKAVEECFNEMNLDISGSKDFKPHLTFLKLSKAPRLKRRGFRKICSDLYKEYEDSFFGTEVFSQIDLCAMRKKKQESGYYYCECSINVGSRGTEESKDQEMQTEDKGETSSEDPPGRAAGTETEATAASCYLAPHSVAADDKPSENIAEVLIASKEKEINEVNGQPEATDETFLAAGEICSESVPALLPVRLDALLSVEENQEKAKITDHRLQKTEATVCAPDLPTSSE